MIKRTLRQLAEMSGAELIQARNPDATARGAVIDSRKAEPDCIYIPLKGARADGHDFIEQVKEAGAAVSFWNRKHEPYPENIPLLLVNDTLEAMQKLAASYIKEVNPLRIGITGSNGKTSTKDMTASVLSEKYRTVKTQGNHNNEIGLPLTIFDLDDDTQAAVLEMGMENYGEIEFLCRIAPLDIALLVSIGSAHLENFGNRENIARAKCEIIGGLRKGGVFIYDKDSPEIERVLPEISIPESVQLVSFSGSGSSEANVYRDGDILYAKDGIQFPVSGFHQEVLIHAAGSHQTSNALAAVCAGLAAGLDEEQILRGLEKAELTRMRSRLYPCGRGIILDDSYKSNPESARAGIDTLMQIPADRHIVVMAGMLDLGENEKKLHEEVGAYAREKGADALYTYGKEAEDIAIGYANPASHYEDKQQLTEDLMPLFDQNCAVLIKGSRAFAMDEVVSALLEGKTSYEKD